MAERKFLDYIPQAAAHRLAEDLDQVVEVVERLTRAEGNSEADLDRLGLVLERAKETLNLVRRHP